MKTVSLLLLTPHYAILILLMRYVRTRPGPMFLTSTTVLLAEVFKTITCLIIIFVQQGGARGCVEHLYEFLVCRPWDFAKVCVPSFLFVLQNNLVFVAISNLDAATFQVCGWITVVTKCTAGTRDPDGEQTNTQTNKQSHIGRVYVCLAVTFHLHFWQDDLDF